ncbi:MAG TPA: RHS repeat-associated core domain-containing protein [Alphaproteobacteria bacterium]|jgi:RHS repeat-associated protein
MRRIKSRFDCSDGTGAVIREYLWLGSKPIGLVVGPATSPTLYFVHADQLDRVQKITDVSQAIVWDGQFTPYGRTHAIAGTIQNPLRFPGQWADPAANYFYNYMRDYDPTLARYLSVDSVRTTRIGPARLSSNPVGELAGEGPIELVTKSKRRGRSGTVQISPQRITSETMNKYGYAGANPINRTDSKGEQLDTKGRILRDLLDKILGGGQSAPAPAPTPKSSQNFCPVDDDDEFCRARWGNERQRCRKWSKYGYRWVAACESRADNRYRLCLRNNGRPDPEEPPEWSEADLPWTP